MPMQGTDRGMNEDQVHDRQTAINMAHQVCIADKLEFMRLNEQTEKLRSWLVSKPYQPITQHLDTEDAGAVHPESYDMSEKMMTTQD